MKDGQQVSSTHYFLFPERPAYLENRLPAGRKAVTATVRPLGIQDRAPQTGSQADGSDRRAEEGTAGGQQSLRDKVNQVRLSQPGKIEFLLVFFCLFVCFFTGYKASCGATTQTHTHTRLTHIEKPTNI